MTQKTIYPKSEKDLGNSSDGKRPSLIEQARININKRYAKIFLSQESNQRVYQNHLMAETLRLCINEIQNKQQDTYVKRCIHLFKLRKQEGL